MIYSQLKQLCIQQIELLEALEQAQEQISRQQQSTVTQAIPRMRTIKECFEMIHIDDPESKLSMTEIRKLAKLGRLPTLDVGENKKKILIDYNGLLEYCRTNTIQPPDPRLHKDFGKIRPIPEKLRHVR